MRFLTLALCALPLYALGTTPDQNPELHSYNPIANPSSVFTFDIGTRITILTTNLIRLESIANPDGGFEDRASLAFNNRQLPTPKFKSTLSEDKVLLIELDNLILTYNTLEPLSPSSFTVVSTDPESAFENWSYGDSNQNQLPGTIRTLDQTGPISLNCPDITSVDPPQGESYHCTMGLISSTGHAVAVDDTLTPLLDPETSFWSDSPSSDKSDIYLFTHGKDYAAALRDFSLVSGPMPLPPRNSLGIWFTRWINYNSASLKSVIAEYGERSIPLDVLVLDMNWHSKDGWTGYTFDDRLFPFGGEALLSKMHDCYGLYIGANIHDADGVGPWEDGYDDMAAAVNFDTSKNETIPFASCFSPDSSNPSLYAYALDDHVLSPLEKQGVNFWWIDWQQGPTEGGCMGGPVGSVGGWTPTIQLNRLRVTAPKRRGNEDRGMVLARWGGLGNHRYQVGFSGDVDEVKWDRLAYQPYFSASAANVGFGLWSHDIVGGDGSDPELFLRWIQWGAFSSIFRTHDRGMSSGGCQTEEDGCNLLFPWDLPQDLFIHARSVLQTRSRLIPYIYTATHEMHKTLKSFLRPIYWDFPDHTDSFEALTIDGKMSQYMFGDDMFIAPVVAPSDPDTKLATKRIYIPPGQWVHEATSNVYDGPTHVTLSIPLSDTPQFVKYGAVIPMRPKRTGDNYASAISPFNELEFHIYDLKDEASAKVYEDDGATTRYYESDKFSTVNFKYTFKNGVFDAKVQNSAALSTDQNYHVVIHNCPYSTHASVKYDLDTFTCTFPLLSSPITFSPNPNAFAPLNFLSKANSAKNILDEEQITPGSMTGQQTHSANLSVLASLSDVFEHALLKSDERLFLQTLSTLPSLMDNAIAEIEELLNEKQDDKDTDVETISRVKKALAILKS